MPLFRQNDYYHGLLAVPRWTRTPGRPLGRHTLYGKQVGGRKSYNPKNEGKKSYQPILTETREYLAGGLRNGDRLTGKEVAEHLRQAFGALPACVKQIFARADSGF